MVMAMKRPSAKVKKEPATPKRRRHQAPEPDQAAESEEPGMAVEEAEPAEAEVEPGEAEVEPGEAEEEQAEPDKADETEPVKAAKVPPKAKGKAKAKAKGLPAPSKAAWNDMAYSIKKLAKAGKPGMAEAWQKASSGSQQQKREFYYNIFLLDPEQSSKQVHKESLERLTVSQKTIKGWMTATEIGKLDGLDPSDPDFKVLCAAACEGLKEREHENPNLAKRGMKQYYYEKVLAKEEVKANESLTKAKQEVEIEDVQDFAKAEQALMAVPESNQVVLGKKSLRKAVENEAEYKEATPEEAYKQAYLSLSKAVKAFSSSLDKLLVLKEALNNKNAAEPSAQLEASLNELKNLQQVHEDLKSQWVIQMGSFTPTVDATNASDGKLTKKLESLKDSVEKKHKELSKAVNPHKLWAKNAGLV
eukprot:s1024_g2.t1